jgi:uncharacterized membrane protein
MTTERIRSIDVLRGLVMVLMVVDHVRVYSGVPAGGTEPGVFFTRWITHFCAPAFAFFAGTSALLYGATKPRGALSRFLLTRGLLLIALEFTVIKASWTFALDYTQFVLFGVIWMLGACMVAMAALVWLPVRLVAVIGVGTMAFQQVFGWAGGGWPWELIYPSGVETPSPLVVLYTLLPWLGVMAAGYGFGALVSKDVEYRNRWSLRLGFVAIAAFGIGATVKAALAPPAPEGGLPLFLAILNQAKYPPSQLFLLMTLGPMLALVPLAERSRGLVGRVLETFGRVPMFFYLAHIPLIHLLALAVGKLRDGVTHPEWYARAPYVWVPEEHRWSLGLLYAVFVVAVASLYPLCRWFQGVKSRGRGGWLRYL